jgi:hypothetical protein
MNFTQEFEFICRDRADRYDAETIKRYISEGATYNQIVEVFLEFLSSAYGYEITLEKLCPTAKDERQIELPF